MLRAFVNLQGKGVDMGDVYIVEACRSAIGKRGKGLAGLKPADLLGKVLKAAIDRSGISPEH